MNNEEQDLIEDLDSDIVLSAYSLNDSIKALNKAICSANCVFKHYYYDDELISISEEVVRLQDRLDLLSQKLKEEKCND